MAWGKNGTPETLTGTASQVQITDLAGNKFNQFMRNELKSASMTVNTIFNNDTGNLYAYRISYSGGADGTPSVNQPKLLESTGNDVGQEFHIMYSCWISGEEKLVLDFGVESNTSAASTAPTRSEFAGKYVPSSLTDTCDRIDGVASTSTLAISSNLSALGSDLTPAAAVPFAENAQVGSRAEITDTRKIYHKTDEYKLHTFTTTGASTFQVTAGSGDVEYLVVAGGGGGGMHEGAGGGAGGFLTATGFGVTAQSYGVTVGDGGASSGTSVGNTGGAGGNSVFSTVTSIGGGGGGYSGGGSTAGASGGSGGGGAGNGGAGDGTSGQGYAGGAGGGVGGNYPAGGGGGAGQAGGAGSGGTSGDGGDGLQSSITGTATYYAGGGGGGIYASSHVSSGGLGGGGDGSCTPQDGTDGLGGGGGGQSNNSCTTTSAGTGGSGIVIVRYVDDGSITATGGTVTTITSSWTEEGT